MEPDSGTENRTNPGLIGVDDAKTEHNIAELAHDTGLTV